MVIPNMRKILIADTDPILFELAADHFANSNVALVRSTDPNQVISALEYHTIDVAVIALSFSGGNGIDMIAACRSSEYAVGLPIIALAASPDIVRLRLALKAGATAFAVRPINWPLFECQIDFLLAQGEVIPSTLALGGSDNRSSTDQTA